MRNDHGGSLISKFADGLEGERIADGRNIGERLEGFGVADRVTILEKDHRRHGSLSRDHGGNDMSLRVGNIGRESSSGLSS